MMNHNAAGVSADGTMLLSGHHDLRLVAVSIGIAFFAALVALDLAGRVRNATSGVRAAWVCGGGFALGSGIWSMHYVGMAAYMLPFPVMYDWPTVLVSFGIAVISAALALYLISRPRVSLGRQLIGSVVMGDGIAAMHYVGMSAMRVPAFRITHGPFVWLSVFLAVGMAFLALRLGWEVGEYDSLWNRRKVVAALFLGGAIPMMHYAGMAAVRFVPTSIVQGGVAHAGVLTSLGLIRIIVLTLLLLMFTMIITAVNRRLLHHAEALEQSRQRLQTIFDNMSEAVFVVDLQHNVVESNPSALKIFGLERTDLTSGEADVLFELLLKNGVPIERDHWPAVQALRGNYVKNFELQVRRKDTGKVISATASSTPVRNKMGQVTQVIVSYHDITEVKRNNDAFARLAAIVDSSEDAIIGKDDKGLVQSWNAAAERIFGYTAAEMIGESILKLVPEDRRQEEIEFLDRIKQGGAIDHIETLRKRKDGKLIHVMLTISPIRDVTGVVVGASKIARDITEQKQVERQVQQGRKMEAIGQLTGGIAHDFNNLLGVIVGNLDLLERLVSDREAALKRVLTAKRAAGRGADLIRRLMAFSSNEGLKPKRINIAHSIRNVLELAQPALGPEIRIVKETQPSLPEAYVDPSGFETALLNLAVNARDAMQSVGTLKVHTELKHLDESYPPVKTGEIQPGAYICVAVSDTGCGMSRETAERAFEPFFTTKPRDRGTGLGLAMVYGFAKQSGGTVRIYSEVGYGTTVTLYLPLAEAFDRDEVQVQVPEAGKTQSGAVLVVDDEPDLLEIACTYLEELGFECLAAQDGAAALEIARARPDLTMVVTDVIMPGGLNGAELVVRIRALIPQIRVIYSSGFSADALAERSGTPIDGLLLHKPYQRMDLTAMVGRAMSERSSSAKLVNGRLDATKEPV